MKLFTRIIANQEGNYANSAEFVRPSSILSEIAGASSAWTLPKPIGAHSTRPTEEAPVSLTQTNTKKIVARKPILQPFLIGTIVVAEKTPIAVSGNALTSRPDAKEDPRERRYSSRTGQLDATSAPEFSLEEEPRWLAVRTFLFIDTQRERYIYLGGVQA